MIHKPNAIKFVRARSCYILLLITVNYIHLCACVRKCIYMYIPLCIYISNCGTCLSSF